MASEDQQLRAAIVDLHPVKCRRRYSEELKRRLVAHARRRLAQGETFSAVAASLDIGQPTLARFLSETNALVPITVVPGGASPVVAPVRQLVVRGPAGAVIEGASIDDVAALFRRLATCSA
jgi:transposase-like protein